LYILPFVIFAQGCADKNGTSTVPTIELAKSVDIRECSKVSMNDLYEVERVVRLEAGDDSMLPYNDVTGIDGETLVMDFDGIYLFFDMTDGSFVRKFNKTGRGPEEYMGSDIGYVESERHRLIVTNRQSKQMLEYNYVGECLSATTLPLSGTCMRLYDGSIVLSYDWTEMKEHPYAIYDTDFNLIREASFMNKGLNNRIKSVNGLIQRRYFKLLDSDTVYQVTTHADIPVLAIKQGGLKYPEEDRTELDDHPEYIDQIMVELVAGYAFIQYYYDNKIYRDLWDDISCSLAGRAIQTDIDKGYGLPFAMGDALVEVWPQYIDESERLFCFLEPQYAKVVFPDYDEQEDNPVLLILSRRTVQ